MAVFYCPLPRRPPLPSSQYWIVAVLLPILGRQFCLVLKVEILKDKKKGNKCIVTSTILYNIHLLHDQLKLTPST